MDLVKINKLSLTDVCFLYGDEWPDARKYHKIIFAKDGVYNVFETEAVILTQKLDNISYSNPKLKSFPKDKIGFTFKLPKVPMKIFWEIVSIFRYACESEKNRSFQVTQRNCSELMVNIYYDKKKKKYFIDIPENQTVSSASIQFDLTQDKNLSNPDYCYVMNIHSHHTMDAFFSGTDDNDENKNRPILIYGVFGKIFDNFPNVKFRVKGINGFVDITLSEIFDLGIQTEIPKKYKNKIDKIINKSMLKDTFDLYKADYDPDRLHLDFYKRYGYKEIDIDDKSDDQNTEEDVWEEIEFW